MENIGSFPLQQELKIAASGPVLVKIQEEAKQLSSAIGREHNVKPLKASERMAIRGLEHDSRFFIKRMTQAPTLQADQEPRHVTLTQGDETIHLNIKSLCKRLLLEPEQVREAKDLQKLIEDRAKQLNEAMAHYHIEFQRFKQLVPDSQFSALLFEKMVLASHGLWSKELETPYDRNKNLLLGFKQRQLVVVDLNDLVQAGEGGHAKVFKVQDIANGGFYALKAGAPSVRDEAFNIEAANLFMSTVQAVPILSGQLPVLAFGAHASELTAIISGKKPEDKKVVAEAEVKESEPSTPDEDEPSSEDEAEQPEGQPASLSVAPKQAEVEDETEGEATPPDEPLSPDEAEQPGEQPANIAQKQAEVEAEQPGEQPANVAQKQAGDETDSEEVESGATTPDEPISPESAESGKTTPNLAEAEPETLASMYLTNYYEATFKGEKLETADLASIIDAELLEKEDKVIFINRLLEMIQDIIKLHDNDCVHGDIKPDNILWTGNKEKPLDLIDWGSFQSKDSFNKKKFGVTTAYVPKTYRNVLFFNESNEDLTIMAKALDLFCMGYVLFLVVTGDPEGLPFRLAESKIYGEHPVGKLQTDLLEKNDCSPALVKLLETMLDLEAPTTDQELAALVASITQQIEQLKKEQTFFVSAE